MPTNHLHVLRAAMLRALTASGGRLRRQHGQGTIEYVGLMLLMSVLLAAVVAAGAKGGDHDVTQMIIEKVKGAIDGVGEPPAKR